MIQQEQIHTSRLQTQAVVLSTLCTAPSLGDPSVGLCTASEPRTLPLAPQVGTAQRGEVDQSEMMPSPGTRATPYPRYGFVPNKALSLSLSVA